MEPVIVYPKVALLTADRPDGKVDVRYADNVRPFRLPKIGPRPPYYAHPRHEPYYPIL